MAAGAGSLGGRLGGVAIYHGQTEIRPTLGAGSPPAADDLERAITLIRRSLWLWLAALLTIGFLHA
jgi:adenosylcobinamide-phosphate synthase